MLNNINIYGRLAETPEIKYTTPKKASCKFRIACERKIKTGAKKETDFFSCISWGKTAEFISKYFKKGSTIIINGSLRSNNYKAENGENRYYTEILIEEVHFTGADKKETEGD